MLIKRESGLRECVFDKRVRVWSVRLQKETSALGECAHKTSKWMEIIGTRFKRFVVNIFE